MTFRVACVGECMIELREQPDGTLTRGFGGDTLNTAIYMARLGVAVDYVTALGDDTWSEEMVAGSIRTRASECNPCSRTEGDVWLGSLQDGQHGHASTEEAQPALVGSDVLVMVGSGAEEVAQLVVTSAEPGG